MNILITGGSGFVGRNVAKELRTHPKASVFTPTHAELDMTDLPSYVSYLNKNDIQAVIHTAFEGHFASKNEYDTFLRNIKMYDNISWGTPEHVPVILIGSGAEFDRRFNIDEMEEADVFTSYPVDFYGMAKKMITDRALNEDDFSSRYVLRLFGCFGHDEPDFRFIKNSILRVKKGLPIEITENKKMDFFFIDDVAPVIEAILFSNTFVPRNLNLVYASKIWLSDVARIILDEMGKSWDDNIVFKNVTNFTKHYTGCGGKLSYLKIHQIGLNEGIKRMVEKLK